MQGLFGEWIFLLNGQVADDSEDFEEICELARSKIAGACTAEQDNAIAVLANAALSGSLASVPDEISSLLGEDAIEVFLTGQGKPCRTGPVCLILDKELQCLPFEGMPVLRRQDCSRMMSLWAVSAALKTRSETCDVSSGFYVLNPSGDLPQTEKRFAFLEDTWERVPSEVYVADDKPKKPDAEKLLCELTEKDLFLYCGHGSSEKYLPRSKLREIQCNATVLLMGCSSGLLQEFGDFEPTGMALEYLTAGAPCVVGNLWDLTDGDLDKFCISVLKVPYVLSTLAHVLFRNGPTTSPTPAQQIS